MPWTNFWEYYAPVKALYSACMEPVCKKHNLARTELDILLFLVNNPQYDTATDIVEVRYLAKSHVSTSVKALERAGLLEKHYRPEDRRTAHLRVLPAADALVADGRKAQKHFISILLKGLCKEEQETLQMCFEHVQCNIKDFMEGKKSCL